MNKLAIALNKTLGDAAEFLSPAGRRMYFPYGGILGQGAEAKACDINATVGMAFEEDGSPLVMDCFRTGVNLDKKSFLYAGSFGLPKLREAWKAMEYVKNPSLNGKRFSSPVVTNALTHGIRVCAELFAGPADTLVCPDLYWDNYELIFQEAVGCRVVHFNTFRRGAFDAAAMKEALLAPGKKKILILNFPNNPTGYTATIEDARKIVSAVRAAASKGKRIVVMCDDAYFGLVYEKGVHGESLFAEFSDLHRNVLARVQGRDGRAAQGARGEGGGKRPLRNLQRDGDRTAPRHPRVRRSRLRRAEAREVRGPQEALPRDPRDPQDASRVRAPLRGDAVQLRVLHVREAHRRGCGEGAPPPDREVLRRDDRTLGSHPPRVLDRPHGEARQALRVR